MLNIIAAMGENQVIGKGNDLPWHLPSDMKHFVELTRGNPVIMGRKTFESIVARLGKPLPKRENIVITSQKDFQADGITVVHSLEEALGKVVEQNAFVIGGAQIYSLAIPYTDRMYVTEVHGDITGDVYFPKFDKSQWKETSREKHSRDEKNNLDYTFVTYERK